MSVSARRGVLRGPFPVVVVSRPVGVAVVVAPIPVHTLNQNALRLIIPAIHTHVLE